tara:strand:+ start:11557 stop:11940 length:384 start_codon:yes stop_codon:yes gene_type:complete
MIKPGSCKSGLRSLPFDGIGNILSNGFELNNINIRKNNNKRPMIDNISATIAFGIFFENIAIKEHQTDITKTHSNIEPSWAPHTAENLYILSKFIFELLATYLSEKSSVKKAKASTKKEIAIRADVI